jgi:membrane protein
MVRVLKAGLVAWVEDRAPSKAAAVAFYTILSLGPGLMVAVSTASFAVGRAEARRVVVEQLTAWSGPDVAHTVLQALRAAREANQTGAGTALGLVAVFLGMTALFAELQDSLNTIFGAASRSALRWRDLVVPRILSFLLLLLIGILIFVSVTLGTALSMLGRIAEEWLSVPEAALQVLDGLVSFALMTLLFSVIYKVLPDVRLHWRDTWLGAIITSALFTAGRWAIASYLSAATLASVYGSSASLALLLLWVYYSSQVFFLGAELTAAYARFHGGGIQPRKGR